MATQTHAIACFIATITLALIDGAQRPDDRIPNGGSLAASAILEISEPNIDDRIGAFEHLMSARMDHAKAGKTVISDPCPAWLAAKLSFLAASKRLFSLKDGNVEIRIPEQIGDNKFRYIASFSAEQPDGSMKTLGEPRFLWLDYGAIGDPGASNDDQFVVSGLAGEDMVLLQIHRVPRDIAEPVDIHAGRYKPASALESPSCRLLVHLWIPVLVN